MKKLLFLFLLIPFIGKAQLYHTMPQYGYQMQRADVQYVLKVPSDTTTNKTGVARIGTTLYAGNGTYWTGSGSVASFSSGNLSPLFTTSVATSTSTPALSFSLSNAGGYTLFGRGSGSGSPSYLASIDSNWVTGLHTENYYNTKYRLESDNQRTIQYIGTNTFTALTGYTAVGSPTYSISGGKVVFTGTGTGSVSNITKYIRNDLGVLDECNTIQGTVTIDAAPDANSYGVSIGFKTYTSYGSTQSLTAGVVCATGANFGKPFIYSAYSSTVYYGTANTDINNGDVIRLSLVTSGWTLRLLVQNFTQGWEESLDLPNVGGFTPLTHNGSYPSFFHNGGNVSLDSFKYTINAPLATDILFVGNSITYGQSATTVAKRWVNLVGNTANNIMSGGGSEVTADFITRLPEIVAINPQRVILHDLAGNDIANAISSATWQANLITIRNTLNAAGIQVIWTNGQPRTGLDLTAQKTFIEGEATFAGDMIIDTWSAMLGSGTNPVSAYMADATHPNDLGMAATANAINKALGYPTNIGIRFGVNTAFADIGTGSIYGNATYGLTLRGRTGSAADLTWFDVAGNAVLWIPTGTYDVLTQGKFGVGLLGGTATANLHIKAATATANTGQLKFDNSTLPTTPETGLMNFRNGLWFIDSSNSVRDTIAGRGWVRNNISGGGLTVGTSTITSGTDTKVLYNNAGTLGEYTISGSGNVAMTTSPTFTTPALGTPSALVGTNITGTAASLTAGNATTLATSRNLNGAAFNGSADVLVPEINPSVMALLGSTILAEPVTGNVFKTASSANLTDGQVRWVAIYIPRSMTITGVKWIQQTQGSYTADNYNGVGLYSYSGGNLTLVASSTNDGNIWKPTSFTWSSKAFSSTYSASPGLYFAALIYNSSAQTTAPALRVNQLSSDLLNTVDFTNSAKLGASLTAQTTLPAGPTAMSTLATMSGVAYLALY